MAITQEFANQLHAAALQGVLANPDITSQGSRTVLVIKVAKQAADAYIQELGGVEPPISDINAQPDEDTGYEMD